MSQVVQSNISSVTKAVQLQGANGACGADVLIANLVVRAVSKLLGSVTVRYMLLTIPRVTGQYMPLIVPHVLIITGTQSFRGRPFYPARGES